MSASLSPGPVVKARLLPVEAEEIPEGTGLQFRKWCAAHQRDVGMIFSGGGRRAYSTRLEVHVRDSELLIWHQGRPLDFMYRDDLCPVSADGAPADEPMRPEPAAGARPPSP